MEYTRVTYKRVTNVCEMTFKDQGGGGQYVLTCSNHE